MRTSVALPRAPQTTAPQPRPSTAWWATTAITPWPWMRTVSVRLPACVQVRACCALACMRASACVPCTAGEWKASMPTTLLKNHPLVRMHTRMVACVTARVRARAAGINVFYVLNSTVGYEPVFTWAEVLNNVESGIVSKHYSSGYRQGYGARGLHRTWASLHRWVSSGWRCGWVALGQWWVRVRVRGRGSARCSAAGTGPWHVARAPPCVARTLHHAHAPPTCPFAATARIACGWRLRRASTLGVGGCSGRTATHHTGHSLCGRCVRACIVGQAGTRAVRRHTATHARAHTYARKHAHAHARSPWFRCSCGTSPWTAPTAGTSTSHEGCRGSRLRRARRRGRGRSSTMRRKIRTSPRCR